MSDVRYGNTLVEVVEDSGDRVKIKYATADEHIEHWVQKSDLVYMDCAYEEGIDYASFDQFEKKWAAIRRALEKVHFDGIGL